MRIFRRVFKVLSSLAIACSLSSCSMIYDYEVRGTIKEFPDGKPAAGVHVSLKEYVSRLEPTTSRDDGKFVLRFRVANPRPDDPLTLTLTKDGYVDESVDISQSQLPASSNTTTPIAVVAYVRTK